MTPPRAVLIGIGTGKGNRGQPGMAYGVEMTDRLRGLEAAGHPYAHHRYVLPPSLLTEAQRNDLTRTLEGSLTGDGDATQALYEAVSRVIPFTTLNIQTAARWLLAQDERIRAGG